MRTSLEHLLTEGRITIEWWDDPNDGTGHDPRSAYVERFWLPILGPSATLMLRYFATRLELCPNGLALDLGETARVLGLGDRAGRNGPFMRTIARAIDFRMARVTAPMHLAIRHRLPTLSERTVVRLPQSLQVSHARALERSQLADSTLELRQSGRRLALSLLRLGETEEEAIAQLVQWRFDEHLARDCVSRAMTHEHATRGGLNKPRASTGAITGASTVAHAGEGRATGTITKGQPAPQLVPGVS